MHPTSLIPPIGSVSQALRAFRVAWVDRVVRGASGEGIHAADFVARYSGVLCLLDVRAPSEATGAVGRIPGVQAVAPEDAVAACRQLDPFHPIIVVDNRNESAPAVARALEGAGHHLVAHVWDGMTAWRSMGYGVTRDEMARVLRVEVPPTAFEPRSGALSEDDIREHLGDPRAVIRQKLASLLTHGNLSCVDGRDHGALLGTPGGDGGEFLLALGAVEQLTGRRFTDDEVRTSLERRLDAFGPCAIHTDMAAANRAIAAIRADPQLAPYVAGISETLEWRTFWRRPPAATHARLLELSLAPEHLGCGHLKLLLSRASAYGTRVELVQAFLRAFFRIRWEGSEDTQTAPLPGGHAEGAVLRVYVAEPVGPFSFVPLISPMCRGTQTFVAHPEVATSMRGLYVRQLVEEGVVDSKDEGRLRDRIRELAAVQLGHTLQALAPGLPVYDVTFSRGHEVRVESAGRIET